MQAVFASMVPILSLKFLFNLHTLHILRVLHTQIVLNHVIHRPMNQSSNNWNGTHYTAYHTLGIKSTMYLNVCNFNGCKYRSDNDDGGTGM